MDPVLAYGLIVLGLFLCAAEVFLPTMGILAVLGIAAVVAGLAMIFRVDSTQGFVTLVVIFVLVPIAGPILLHLWPRTPIGKRFLLSGPEEDATIASMPTLLELEHLRGRYGKTVSPLRPSGTAEFDGRRVDVMSEGDLVDAERWVRCVDVRAGRVLVRPVDRAPNLGDLPTLDLGGAPKKGGGEEPTM